MNLEAVLLETIGALLVFSPLGREVGLQVGTELWINYRHLLILLFYKASWQKHVLFLLPWINALNVLFLVLYCFFFCRCSPLSTFLVAQWDFSHSAADAPDELLRGGATSAVLRVSRGHWDRGRDSSASSTYYSSLLPMKHVNFPWVLACISICISFQVTGVIVVFWHTFSSGEKQY